MVQDNVMAVLKSPLGAQDVAGGRSPQALKPHFNSYFLQFLGASSHRLCCVPCRYTRGAPRPLQLSRQPILTSERLFNFLLRHVLKAVFILFFSAGNALSEVTGCHERRAGWLRTVRGMRELQFAQWKYSMSKGLHCCALGDSANGRSQTGAEPAERRSALQDAWFWRPGPHGARARVCLKIPALILC